MSTRELRKILSNRQSRIVVVGATDQQHKYGALIYRRLKASGYRVIPVNPHRSSVDGDVCYPSVLRIPEKPDLINIITPPEVTQKILKDCLQAGWMNVWLQPGAADSDIIRFLQAHPFQWIAGDCILFYLQK